MKHHIYLFFNEVIYDMWFERNIFLSCIKWICFPLSLFYYLSLLKRNRKKPQNIKSHVICIGNITVGGNGKTPLAIAICESFKSLGYRVAFVSRGYIPGKKSSNTVSKLRQQEKNLYNAEEFGDEAMLLVKMADVYISKNRYIAAKMASDDGVEIIIMDDGMQNNSLHKNLQIAVFDSKKGIGNGFLLPAGPLRETFGYRSKYLDYIVIVHCTEKSYVAKEMQIQLKKLILKHNQQHKVIHALIRVQNEEFFYGKQYIGIAGIGHPDKFFDTARSVGVDFVKTFSFPDHYQYTVDDMNQVLEWSSEHNCKILATRKDLQRIPEKFHNMIDILDITIDFDAKNIINHVIRDIQRKN